MREDMQHVLVDRPRYRGWNKHRYKNLRPRSKSGDLEAMPKQEGLRSVYRYDRKSFSDHIRPLERFLKKQVGRPWDKVYSEIRARVSPDSTMQMHLLQHVSDFITLRTLEQDGKLRDADRGRWYPLRKGELYVNRAGIICVYKGDREPKRRLKKGEKVYVLYREKGPKKFSMEDGTRYEYVFKVETREEFYGLPPGSHRSVIYHFIAGSKAEAQEEIERYQKPKSAYERIDREFFVPRAA